MVRDARLNDILKQAACCHPKRTGGNDYMECLECGLMWDYRRETADQVSIRQLLARLTLAEHVWNELAVITSTTSPDGSAELAQVRYAYERADRKTKKARTK